MSKKDENSNGRRNENQKPSTHSQKDRARIAEAAYFKAAQRGFAGGDPVQDWLAAEKEIRGNQLQTK